MLFSACYFRVKSRHLNICIYPLMLLMFFSSNISASSKHPNIAEPSSFLWHKTTSLIKANRIHSNKQKSLTTLMQQIKPLNDFRKIQVINNYFNQFKNISDLTLWGTKEYWATPKELLSQNGGDCEDFAVAKYYFLKKAGVREKSLRLAYVIAYIKETMSIENHLVLLYYNKSTDQEYVLDNINKSIEPVLQRKDLSYQFAFNQLKVWTLNKKIKDYQIKRSRIFKSWQGVLNRMDKVIVD